MDLAVMTRRRLGTGARIINANSIYLLLGRHDECRCFPTREGEARRGPQIWYRNDLSDPKKQTKHRFSLAQGKRKAGT